jgi:hypothetical protein
MNLTAFQKPPTETSMAEAGTASPFALVIADTLRAHFPQGGNFTPVIEAIEAAHAARIRQLDAEVNDLQRANFAYASMDRSNVVAMQSVKTLMTALVETNARQSAYIDMMARMRDAFRHLVAEAEQAQSGAVSTADLGAVLDNASTPWEKASPLVVAFAASQLYTEGRFVDENGDVTHLPFIGWSMVVHGVLPESGLEATFLAPDHKPACYSLLALRDGMRLLKMM